MRNFSWYSLRFRLLLLVFFAVVPALAVVVYTASEQQRQVTAELEREAQRLVNLAASNQDQFIEKARQLAATLSRLPVVKNGNSAPCSAVMADLLQQKLPYANFGAARLNGDIYCSAVRLEKPVNVASKFWFRKTVTENILAVSDYQIGKISRRPILVLSYPVRKADNQVQAVAFTALDIAQISELAEQVQLPEEGAIAIFDRNGTILARHPNPEQWIGKSMPEVELVKTIFNQKKGTVEMPGLDGKPRWYAFSRLNSLPEGNIYITIGLSKAAALRQANWQLLRNLAGLGVIGLLMLAAAWVGSDLFVLQQVRALLRATKQVAAGDFRTRIALSETEGELNQLAAAFDQMAETLQKRQEELTRINRALKTLSDCNQALVRATEELNFLQELCAILTSTGGYCLAWVGFAEPDEAKSVRAIASSGYEAGYLESLAITYADAERGQGPTGRAIRTGEIYIAKNILTDENYLPWRKEAIKRGYASSIALPLMEGGSAFGALNIYAKEADAFDAEEVKLLRELAADMAYGITALRSRAEGDRIEQALRESEERYRKLVELCPDAIFIQSEGKFVFANRAAVKLYGADAVEQILGKAVLEFVHPDFREIVCDRIKQLREERKEAPLLEEKWLRLDGSVFDADVAAIPFTYQGKPAAQVVVRDISDRKLAAENLKRSEELYRTLARNLPNGAVILFDRDLRYLLAEGTDLLEIQLNKGPIEGKKIEECLLPETYKLREPSYRAALDGIATISEIKYASRIYSVHTLPVKNDRGEIFAGMIVSQDISDRVQAQETLRKLNEELEIRVAERTSEAIAALERLQREFEVRVQAEAALRESEERFRSAFDYAAIGMALVSPEGRWLMVNQFLCEILGYSEEELLTMTFQNITHPDDLEADLIRARQMLAGDIKTYQMEKRYFHKQGHVVWAFLSVSAVWEVGGHLLYFIAQIQDITQRKRAEAALKASQTRLAGILDIAKDAIISTDSTQRITLFNQGAENIFGYAAREVLGQPLDVLLPDRFAELHRHHVARFAESADTARRMGERVEVFGRRKDGREFPAEASISKLELAGEIIFTVFLRDISDRKQAEEALSQLAAIVEYSDDAIIGKNLQGIIQTWNAGAEKIYGYSAAEVKGRPISLLIPPERPDEMERILDRIIAGYGIDSYETERIRKDGQRIAVSLTVSPIKDAAGKVIGASSISRDISHAKRVEAALAKLRHQSELILNAVGDGIYGMDLQGNATFINLSAARMLGYEVGELMGQPMHATIHHSKPNGTPYPLDECPLSATFKDGSFHRVTDEVFWRKDGSSFPIEYASAPILEQGKIVGAVVTFKDITERRAIEQMKEEFISVVSHELRTPLTSIRTSLALLTSGLLENQPQRAKWMLEVAMESTHRLVRLVNDILDIERIESGKAPMNKEACDAADLMVQAADVMRAMAEKAGVILSITPLAAPLWADPDRVIQTLTNLLSNAIKFSPPGATIWLTAERRDEWVLFQVKDRGRGIPADKLETIFGRFQQVDASDSRKQGGTGLGLAICRTIVQQHGGRIWAESILGEGSSFYFTLPLLAQEI